MGIVEDQAGKATAFIILDESIPEIATATGLCCDGRQEQQQFVFPFDVNAAVREMEPIDFSLPSNFLDPCNVQPILQAKPARRVENNCSVCSHCSFGQKQQQRADTSGG